MDIETNSDEEEKQQQAAEHGQPAHQQLLKQQEQPPIKKPPNFHNKHVIVCGVSSRTRFDVCDKLLANGISKLALLESDSDVTIEVQTLRAKYSDKEILYEVCDNQSQVDIKSKLEKIAIEFAYIIDYFLIFVPLMMPPKQSQILLLGFFHTINLTFAAIDFHTEAIKNNKINNDQRFTIGSIIPVNLPDDRFKRNFPVYTAKHHAIVGFIYSLAQRYEQIRFFTVCYQHHGVQYEMDRKLIASIIGDDLDPDYISLIVHHGSIERILPNNYAEELRLPF